MVEFFSPQNEWLWTRYLSIPKNRKMYQAKMVSDVNLFLLKVKQLTAWKISFSKRLVFQASFKGIRLQGCRFLHADSSYAEISYGSEMDRKIGCPNFLQKDSWDPFHKQRPSHWFSSMIFGVQVNLECNNPDPRVAGNNMYHVTPFSWGHLCNKY